MSPLRPANGKDAGTEVTLWDFKQENYSHTAPLSFCPSGRNKSISLNKVKTSITIAPRQLLFSTSLAYMTQILPIWTQQLTVD